MSSVVDFLERIGSDARWRDASQDEIELALADAGIDSPMCTAILTRNAADLKALLGLQKLIGDQLPSPEEEPGPSQPDPGEEEQEEEHNGTHGEGKSSNGACDSPHSSSSSSL